ncbi:hypothetical protein [Streptobacillus moniliformis]|uniref:hypothetical protein n=1 Tax=Streptobacillus moniliformis TaxID=34105 RepID=UPI000AED64F0|nr:hypothetical protein [Streptobacillus moniliformis]
MNKLELKKVYKKYNDQDKYVLEDISLIINNGEFVSIMVRSGSGDNVIMMIVQ